jgi:hypothetical protein
MIYRIVPSLVAALLATTAVSWLFDPAAAAAGLGMTYLDGIGRSTQVGDFSAFFVFLVIMCVMGVITQTGHYLRSASLLLLLTAIFRTTAWALYGAELATTFIVAELVMAGLLFFSASRIGQQAEQA